jgi:hypothetical protein
MLNKSQALILALADKYHVLGFDISHLELQKLAYFLQEFGQNDLKLNFTKGAYGPYALNLKHLLAHLEGHYFKGQIRFQDLKPTDALQLVNERMADVQRIINNDLDKEEKRRLEKVITFIEGYESPFGLELLATVHWAKKELGNDNIQVLKAFIGKWSLRKQQLITEEQIKIALSRINTFFA